MSRSNRRPGRQIDEDDESARTPRTTDIGPAWLLLSHGAFLAAIAVGSNTGYSFLIANPAHVTAWSKALAIVACVGSLLVGAWTIYAINGTWRENRKLLVQVYGNGGFTALMLIVVYLIATALLTLVAVALYPLP